MVQAAVARPREPRPAVLVQTLTALKQAPPEEVALDILHRVLHLPLALRVALAAEHGIEVHLGNEGTEAAREKQVAQVLVVKQHLVLVVKYLAGHAAKVLESQLMGIHRSGSVEGTGPEMHKLVARPAEHQNEEVHLLTPAVGTLHPVLTEVCLAVLAERQLRKPLVGTGRLLIALGNAVLQPEADNEVEHRLAADILQIITIALLQTVLYLPAGETRELAQKADNERLVAVQLVAVLTMADAAGKKIFLAHAKILADCAAIDS